MAYRGKNVVEVEDFSKAVSEVLEKYYGGVADGANLLVASTAVEVAQKLQSQPTTPKKRGDYARGWYVRQNKKRKDECELEVANHVYQLTHLLEYGHVQKVHGKIIGFTDAQPHIKPVEQEAIRKLLDGVGKLVRVVK